MTVRVVLFKSKKMYIRIVEPISHEGAQMHIEKNSLVVGLLFITSLEADAAFLYTLKDLIGVGTCTKSLAKIRWSLEVRIVICKESAVYMVILE